MGATSRSGASAARRRVSSAMRASRKRRVRQKSTTPTLINSSRSTRGTTRTIAYSNTSRTSIDRLLDKRAWSFQASKQVLYVRRPVCRKVGKRRLVAQPRIGNRGYKIGDQGG